MNSEKNASCIEVKVKYSFGKKAIMKIGIVAMLLLILISTVAYFEIAQAENAGISATTGNNYNINIISKEDGFDLSFNKSSMSIDTVKKCWTGQGYFDVAHNTTASWSDIKFGYTSNMSLASGWLQYCNLDNTNCVNMTGADFNYLGAKSFGNYDFTDIYYHNFATILNNTHKKFTFNICYNSRPDFVLFYLGSASSAIKITVAATKWTYDNGIYSFSVVSDGGAGETWINTYNGETWTFDNAYGYFGGYDNTNGGAFFTKAGSVANCYKTYDSVVMRQAKCFSTFTGNALTQSIWTFYAGAPYLDMYLFFSGGGGNTGIYSAMLVANKEWCASEKACSVSTATQTVSGLTQGWLEYHDLTKAASLGYFLIWDMGTQPLTSQYGIQNVGGAGQLNLYGGGTVLQGGSHYTRMGFNSNATESFRDAAQRRYTAFNNSFTISNTTGGCAPFFWSGLNDTTSNNIFHCALSSGALDVDITPPTNATEIYLVVENFTFETDTDLYIYNSTTGAPIAANLWVHLKNESGQWNYSSDTLGTACDNQGTKAGICNITDVQVQGTNVILFTTFSGGQKTYIKIQNAPLSNPPLVNDTSIKLWINGTEGNAIISYGDITNITAQLNSSGLVHINISAPTDSSIYVNNSGQSIFTWNASKYTFAGYNVSVNASFAGNSTHNASFAVHYISVVRANTSYTIAIDKTSPQEEGTTIGIECRLNVSQNTSALYLYRNGTQIGPAVTYPFLIYNDTPESAATWTYWCLGEYSQNYTNTWLPSWPPTPTPNINFTITAIKYNYTDIKLWLNSTAGADSCAWPCIGRNMTAQSNTTGVNILIWKNGTLLSNSSAISTNNNASSYWSKNGEFKGLVYNITAEIQTNATIIGSSITRYLTINKAGRTCSLTTDKLFARTYDATPSSTTCSVDTESGDGSYVFTRNGTTIGVTNPDVITNAGWYPYTCSWTSGVNYSTCAQQSNTLHIDKATIQPYILVNSSRNTYHSLRDGANPNTIMGWEFGAFDAPVWLNMSFAYLPNLPAGDVGCSIAYSNQVKGTSWITYLGSGGLDYLKANCTETTNVFANSTGENVLLNTGLTRANSYPRILLNNTVANWTMLPNGTYYKPTFKMGETLNISCSYTATDNSFSLPNSQIYGDINKVVEPNCYLTGTNATGKGWILQTFPTLTDPYDMLYYSKVYDNSTIITGNATGQVAILHIISKNHTYPYLLVNGSAMDYLPHYTYGAWLNLTCMNGANPNNSEPVCSIMNESSIDVGNSIMLYRPADVTGAGNTYKAYIPNETISYLSNSTGQVYIFIIDKSSDVYPYILINGSRIFTFIANDWVNISCDYSSNPPSTEPSCTISRDGVVKGTSEQVQLSEGAYLITANSSATPNYTANNTGESMILSTGPPISVNLDMQASNPACGGFYPSLGLHNYTVYSVVNISVYPYCKFWYWNITSKPQIYDTSFNLLMNGNYTVKAYFNTTGQDATAGGGISANDTGAVAAVLNPFLAGYMMLALFHLAIAGVAVYVTKSAVFGIGVFFLFLLVFLAGGLYPSAIWAIVIAIVAIIMTMIMAKIRGGQS